MIGIKCKVRDKKNLGLVSSIIFISGLLWIILENRLIEKIEVKNDEIATIKIIIRGCHEIILINIIISLNRLIVGGAEILIDVNINHQKVMLGKEDINPLKDIMLRVWNFK